MNNSYFFELLKFQFICDKITENIKKIKVASFFMAYRVVFFNMLICINELAFVCVDDLICSALI